MRNCSYINVTPFLAKPPVNGFLPVFEGPAPRRLAGAGLSEGGIICVAAGGIESPVLLLSSD